MGEEKKTEEKKMEEKKPDEKKEEKTETKNPIGDAKDPNKAEESKDPPTPQEIVLRVYMHCEGCAKKVRKCLKGFEGVEDVLTDCKSHKVVVKGEKADPVKVLERVQKKSHGKVELLSPILKPPPPEAEKKEEKEIAKPEEKKEEPPVITVILKIHMHCEACAQEIRKRILKMKGVENTEADLKSSLVTVKGIFDPQNLVDYVRKRTGKQAVIVKQEPEKKEEEKGKEEKKGGDEAAKEKKLGEGEVAAAAVEGEGEDGKVFEMKKNELYNNYPPNSQIYPYPPRFEVQSYYAPQIFSDENPNACSVM
ncbi:heavy metal-associated isoprenylated plant protein 7-like isoform X2 [Actinidia eriantha]|uniref:heavy metal-associated isoprenylated plant protein 7-like isoform X2 n=1 Tax=Actinidia eriantha TaxID=165200 RepID=UPI002589BFC1|nr:heavy metal-associated isoprenylated plant protein 7-like isoform X2 [Actinidia eriantha]